MSPFDRRDFLKSTVGALAATACMPAWSAAATTPKAASVRKLGKTGLSCSLLGIGTGTRGGDTGTDQTRLPDGELVRLLEHAYRRGITYFDLADFYKSHRFMKEAMKKSIPREKVLLLTKAWNREPEKIRADIDRFRLELDTDYLDVVLMHCLRGGEDDWPNTLRASMDVLADAKAKGHIRAHGVSCHTFPSLQRVADEPWTDVVLVRINPFGVNMDASVDEVVPTIKKIHDAGKGVLAMKVLGEGNPDVVAKMDESLKFVLGLGTIHAMTIGFVDTKQLDELITRIDAVDRA